VRNLAIHRRAWQRADRRRPLSTRRLRWLDLGLPFLARVRCRGATCRDDQPAKFSAASGQIPPDCCGRSQSRLDNSRDALMTKLCTIDLLIVDDFALEPMSREESRDVYLLSSAMRAPRGSSPAIATCDWLAVFDDALLAKCSRSICRRRVVPSQGQTERRKRRTSPCGSGYKAAAQATPPNAGQLIQPAFGLLRMPRSSRRGCELWQDRSGRWAVTWPHDRGDRWPHVWVASGKP
jgi:hypothetical protein